MSWGTKNYMSLEEGKVAHSTVVSQENRASRLQEDRVPTNLLREIQNSCGVEWPQSSASSRFSVF